MKVILNRCSPWTWARRFSFLLTVIILLNVNVVHATELLLEKANGHPSIVGHLSWLIDRTGQMTFEQAVEQDKSGHFSAAEGEEVDLGFLPNGAVWIHFALDRHAYAPTVWWLGILMDTLDHIDLFIEQPDGSFAVRRNGRVFPFTQRELEWRGYAFRLALEQAGVSNIYIRTASIGTLRIPLGLWLEKDFERFRAVETFSFGMFFGVMGIAFLLSAFRSLRYRSSLDSFYAFYIFGIEISNFATYGYFHQTGLSENFLPRAYLSPFGHTIACLALVWFVVKLIDWPNLLIRRLNVAVFGITVTYLLIIILILAIAPRSFPMWTTTLSSLLGFATFLASLWAAWRGWKYSRLFVLAFSPFVILALFLQAGSLGFLNGTWQLRIAYLLATAFHVVFLFAVILNRDAGLRQVKTQLEWQVARLNEEMNHQSLFLRMLTHEVRTPLAVIDSNTQLLAMQNHEKESIAPQIVQIRANVSRLSELLDRCLSQDRLASLSSCRQYPIDLVTLINVVAAEVQSKTEDHLITCRIESLPESITGNAGLLKIMLTNLVENAVHYSPDGGNITLTTYADAMGKIVIDVCDEGVGIQEDASERIFDCYYRTQQVEGAVGVGLGLYITRKIARLHGGDVVCESVLGEGSRFRVTLAHDGRS